MNWNTLWAVWIVVGVVAEFNRLIAEDYTNTLTGFMRRFFLHNPFGTAFIGALLGWLFWHWLWDETNPHYEDVIALLGGVVLGVTGWWYRRRQKQDGGPEEAPPA